MSSTDGFVSVGGGVTFTPIEVSWVLDQRRRGVSYERIAQRLAVGAHHVRALVRQIEGAP